MADFSITFVLDMASNDVHLSNTKLFVECLNAETQQGGHSTYTCAVRLMNITRHETDV